MKPPFIRTSDPDLLIGGNPCPAMLTALQNGNEVLAAQARAWDDACLKC